MGRTTLEDSVNSMDRIHALSDSMGMGTQRGILDLDRRTMKIWDKDSERGALLGAIGAIVLFTFVFPDPDVDLGVVFPGNPPYGLLWYLLNPFYWTKKLYPMIIF